MSRHELQEVSRELLNAPTERFLPSTGCLVSASHGRILLLSAALSNPVLFAAASERMSESVIVMGLLSIRASTEVESPTLLSVRLVKSKTLFLDCILYALLHFTTRFLSTLYRQLHQYRV